MNTGSLWSKQEACFAHATSVWLAVNHNISVTSMSDKYCMGKRAWQLSIKLCHSWGYEQFYLSFATGRITCDYYARECEFGMLKKQNKTKQKNKQEKSFGCVLTKWGVPLNSSVVWELTTEGERPFHCGIVRLQKFKDSLKACFEKYCCSKRKSKQNQIFMSQKYMG